MKQEVVLTSEWLDQDRSRDSMKGRVVLLKDIKDDGTVFQHVVTEQWQDSSIEGWENPKTPNYSHGNYFNLDTEITDEILFTFYKRSAKLLQWYLPKRNVTKEIFEIIESFIDLKKVEKNEYRRKDLGIKIRYAISEKVQNLI